MKDRTYFYNRETKEEYYEYISPKQVIYVNRNYLLFEFSNDSYRSEYTLYDLRRKVPVALYSKYIYISDACIILKESSSQSFQKLTIIDLNKNFKETIEECEKYVLNNDEKQLVSYNQNIIKLWDLSAPQIICSLDICSTELIKNYSFVSFTYNNNILLKCEENYLIYNVAREEGKNNPYLLLGNNKHIEISRYFNYLISGKLLYILGEPAIIIRNNRVIATISDKIYRYNNIILIEENTNGEKAIYYYNQNGGKFFLKKGEINLSSFNEKGVLYDNDNDEYSVLSSINGNLSLKKTNLSIINEYCQENHLSLKTTSLNKTYSIAYNHTTNMFIGLKLIINTNNNTPNSFIKEDILKKVYDKTTFKNVYFSSDGSSILHERNNQMIMFDLNGETLGRFPNLHFIKHKNGYRPSFIIDNNKLPRIIDPVTKQFIEGNNINEYVFISPNGQLYADCDVNKYIKYYNCITNKYIDNSEAAAIKNDFDFNSITAQIEKENIIRKRKDFIEKNKTFFANRLFDKNSLFIKHRLEFTSLFLKYSYKDKTTINLINNSKITNDECLTLRKRLDVIKPNNVTKDIIEQRISFVKDHILYFCSFESEYPNISIININEFSAFIIEKRGFAIIRDTNTNLIVDEIELGPCLWFLNYVSFSFDNKYVAIAGRFPYNTIWKGDTVEGLFLVYDLISRRLVIRETATNAVWVSAFSIKGLAAAYTSNPNTLLWDTSPLLMNGNTNRWNVIKTKNFLAFSPDGKYFALSNQGYKSYNSNPVGFGHQESTSVYIYETQSLKQVFPTIDDLAVGGIPGVAHSKENVATCSFSDDNKRILIAGDDGTIVVRNLYFPH